MDPTSTDKIHRPYCTVMTMIGCPFFGLNSGLERKRRHHPNEDGGKPIFFFRDEKERNDFYIITDNKLLKRITCNAFILCIRKHIFLHMLVYVQKKRSDKSRPCQSSTNECAFVNSPFFFRETFSFFHFHFIYLFEWYPSQYQHKRLN